MKNIALRGHGSSEACPDLGQSDVLPPLFPGPFVPALSTRQASPCGLISRLSVGHQNWTTSSSGPKTVSHSSLCPRDTKFSAWHIVGTQRFFRNDQGVGEYSSPSFGFTVMLSPSSATDMLCELRRVTSPLWASISH